jgi:hypothetical protein
MNLRYLIGALAVVAAATGVPGKAATIYDTLSGGTQSGVAWSVNATFIPSAEFTSPGNYMVTQISVALTWGSGTNSATVSLLTADQNGAPGSVLGSWNVSGQTATWGGPATTITGITGVAVLTGQNYFLQISPGDASTGDVWSFSQCCVGTLYNGDTLAYLNSNAPAFSVIGDVYVANPDIFNASNNLLSIPTVTIGAETFSNVIAALGAIVSGPTGSTPVGIGDSYDPTTQLLTIPALVAGSKLYFNTVAKVGKLLSVGSLSGADSYDGANLTIPIVQVLGGTQHTNVVIAVASVDKIGGGIPELAVDEYLPETNQLIIPAVQANDRIYTNVVVTVGTIVSVGTGNAGLTARKTG